MMMKKISYFMQRYSPVFISHMLACELHNIDKHIVRGIWTILNSEKSNRKINLLLPGFGYKVCECKNVFNRIYKWNMDDCICLKMVSRMYRECTFSTVGCHTLEIPCGNACILITERDAQHKKWTIQKCVENTAQTTVNRKAPEKNYEKC